MMCSSMATSLAVSTCASVVERLSLFLAVRLKMTCHPLFLSLSLAYCLSADLSLLVVLHVFPRKITKAPIIGKHEQQQQQQYNNNNNKSIKTIKTTEDKGTGEAFVFHL